MEKPENISWLWWNTANILSLVRNIGPFIFFLAPIEFETKIACYIVLAFTDFFDGWLAKKIGNYGGIGKIIDMFSDKVLHISFFLFLLWEGKLDTVTAVIAALIVIQEIRIASFVAEAISLVAEKELRKNQKLSRKERYRTAYKKVKEGIVNELNANEPGKWKMFAYAIGVYFFLAHFVTPGKILYWYSIFVFLIGLFLSFIAHRKYHYDFEKWKQKFLLES